MVCCAKHLQDFFSLIFKAIFQKPHGVRIVLSLQKLREVELAQDVSLKNDAVFCLNTKTILSMPPLKSLKVASKVQQSPGISGSLHPKKLRMVNMLASSPLHKTRPSRDQTSKAGLTFPADIEVYVRKPSEKSHNKHQNSNLHQES